MLNLNANQKLNLAVRTQNFKSNKNVVNKNNNELSNNFESRPSFYQRIQNISERIKNPRFMDVSDMPGRTLDMLI